MGLTVAVKKEVVIELVKFDSLMSALDRMGTAPEDRDISRTALVEHANKVFGERAKGEPLLVCDLCRGSSPSECAECPFCGESGVESMPKGKGLQMSESEAAGVDGKSGKPKKEKKNGKQMELPGGALVAGQSEVDLNAAVLRVQEAKKDGCLAYWRLGREIRVIRDTQLYKQRTADGKPVYRGFEQFVAAGLGLTATSALRLCDVAEHFDERTVGLWGPTKLSLLLTAPEAARADLRGEMEAGASAAELGKKAKKARAEAGSKVRDTGRNSRTAKATEAAATKRAAATPEKITVAMIVGVQKIAFVTKATAKKAEPTRAKKVADEPVATLELSNRVTLKFALAMDNEGRLVLVLHTKRDDA